MFDIISNKSMICELSNPPGHHMHRRHAPPPCRHTIGTALQQRRRPCCQLSPAGWLPLPATPLFPLTSPPTALAGTRGCCPLQEAEV